MKQVLSSSRIARVTAVLGLTGLFAGLVAVAPAQAQDDWHFHRWQDRTEARWDRDAIRRDENRLHDLYDQRRIAKNNHNWSRVRSLDRRISDLRARLDTNRYELHRDIHR